MKNNKMKKIVASITSILLVGVMITSLAMQFGSGDSELATEKTVVVESMDLATTPAQAAQDVINAGLDANPELDITNVNPAGGGSPDASTFRILEIVPNDTMGTMGYFIGGQEPNEELVIALANNQVHADEGALNIFNGSADNALVPFGMSAGSDKKYVLASGEQVGNKDAAAGNYERNSEAVDAGALISGYFEKLNNGNGLYKIANLTYEVYPNTDNEGKYDAEIAKCYNKAALGALGITDIALDHDKYTDYNYDAIFEYKSTLAQGYYVSVVSPHNNGMYAIDNSATRALFDAKVAADGSSAGLTPEDIEISYKNYVDSALSNVGGSTGYKDLVFTKYDSSAYGANNDIYYGTGKYNISFGYKTDNSEETYYDVLETIFNPGRGEFLAELKVLDSSATTAVGTYYIENTQGKGEYDNYVTDFDVTCITGNASNLSESWVFHETDNSGAPYSTEVESDTMLKTPSFVENSTDNKRAYYARNSFVNYEWFKLFFLRETSYNPEPIDGKSGYKHWLDATESGALKEFDERVKITVEERSPEQVTMEIVEWADFIYINGGMPFGLNNNQYRQYGITIEDFKNNVNGKDLPSYEVGFRIIERAVLEDVALLIDSKIYDNAAPVTKLFQVVWLARAYHDPSNLLYLLEGHRKGENAEYKPDEWSWMQINKDGTFEYSKYNSRVNYVFSGYTTSEIDKFYNSKKTNHSGNWSALRNDEYYKFWPVTTMNQNTIDTGSSTVKIGYDSYTNDDESSEGCDPDDTIYFTPYGIGNYAYLWLKPANNKNMIDSIFTILQRENFAINVTNAIMNLSNKSVIYVDEYDDEYNAYYQLRGSQRGGGDLDLQYFKIEYKKPGTNTWVTLVQNDTEAFGVGKVNSAFYEGAAFDTKPYFDANPGVDEIEFKFSGEVLTSKNNTLKSEKIVTVIKRDTFLLN